MNYEELLNEEITVAWFDIETQRKRIQAHLGASHEARRADDGYWHWQLRRLLDREADLIREHAELLRERDARERGM